MEVLEDIARATLAGNPLFPYSLAQYRRIQKEVEGFLGLAMGWGPHTVPGQDGPMTLGQRVSRLREFMSVEGGSRIPA
eukprot:4575800-Pyramimonas_sp.AAC.1